MPESFRSLDVAADGRPVLSFRRARLTGRDALGLLPQLFLLSLWNLSESDFLLLSRAKSVSVRHGGSLLAFGRVTDASRRATAEGAVTFVAFSPSIDLWEAPVSLSVAGNTSASSTVAAIVLSSGTGIQLLGWAGPDPVFSRGQAFFGRAAECVNEVLSAASARAYLTENGLGVVPAEGLPVSMELSEEDLIDRPAQASGNLVILRTAVTGWPLGKQIAVRWQDLRLTGLVIARSIDADNMQGSWEAELLLEVRL